MSAAGLPYVHALVTYIQYGVWSIGYCIQSVQWRSGCLGGFHELPALSTVDGLVLRGDLHFGNTSPSIRRRLGIPDSVAFPMQSDMCTAACEPIAIGQWVFFDSSHATRLDRRQMS